MICVYTQIWYMYEYMYEYETDCYNANPVELC